jgi:hypothetical protein
MPLSGIGNGTISSIVYSAESSLNSHMFEVFPRLHYTSRIPTEFQSIDL